MGLMFEQNADGHVFGAPRAAYFRSGAGGSGIDMVPLLDLVLYKMAAGNAALESALIGIPQIMKSITRATTGSPVRTDQSHDGPVGGDGGVRRPLEMVVAAVAPQVAG
jgi:hypothetical protein